MDEDARLGGAAYRESMVSVDGFTRDAKGHVKFNKDTKKGRRENEEADLDGDAVMAEPTAETTNRKTKRKNAVKIGQEFKAKACLFFPRVGGPQLTFSLESRW